MKSLFTKKTFEYFDEAKRHKFVKGWYEENKAFYQEAVKEPYSALIEEIDVRFHDKLPRINASKRKIARPVRPRHKAETHGYVKAGAMFFLAEKTTSMFEWNPGLYFHLGDEARDNTIGMGLYGPSSRQIKRLRKAIVRDSKTLKKILNNKNLKKYWGGLADEKYKRFPKDYAEDVEGAEYLWYKQFFLTRTFARKEVLSKDFADLVLKSYEAGLPLLNWIRNAVGVYNRQEMEQEKRDKLARELDQEEDFRD